MIFSRLTPEDYSRYRPFFEHQRYELCEYSLVTLIVWANEEFQPEVATEGDTLFIRGDFTSRHGLRHLMLPVSASTEYTPEDLVILAKQADVSAFWFVPSCYIETYGRQRIEKQFLLQEQTAYQDYVYHTEDLAQLKGNRYAKKRNLISQFLRAYPNPEQRNFEPITMKNAEECIAFLEEWCKTRDCHQDLEDSLTCERLAAKKFFHHMDKFDSKGLLLRLDGKLSAFGVMSRLTNEMGILQFEKAFEHIKGLYQYFDNEMVKKLFTEYRYINKESDMDVPGLARSKRSYHPSKMVTSYQLQLKDG